jgi:chorismate mutase
MATYGFDNPAHVAEDSVFTQYGVDPKGANPLAPFTRWISAQNYGAAKQRNAFNASLEPDYQRALGELLNSYRVSNEQLSNAANERIASNSAKVKRRSRVAGAGGSAGLQSGTSNAIDLNTAGQMNASDAQIYDPARHQQQVMQMIQQLNSAQGSNPFADQIYQGFSAQTQHRSQNLQSKAQEAASSPWNVAANVAGTALGGWAGGGFK